VRHEREAAKGSSATTSAISTTQPRPGDPCSEFYFFDAGILNYLLKRGVITEGSENYGKAFEHFIQDEIYTHSSYRGLHYPVHYWRNSTDCTLIQDIPAI